MTEHREFIDGRWMTEEEAVAADEQPITREEFDMLRKQVAEIHAFIKGLAEALNNPMIKAMMPPHMRGMIGG
jgi:hypothetical protein